MLKLRWLQDNGTGAVCGPRLRPLPLTRVMMVLLFFLGVVGGCATPWVMVGGPYRADSQGYSVDLPTGWRRATWLQSGLGWGRPLLLTRDGVALQYIRIERVAISDELTYTKKKFAKGMSPQEVAALELDEVQSDQTLRNFALVENTPVPVAGLPGFKLIYTFKAENGLRLKRVHYGVMARDWVYRVQYEAPARYYFEKDLTTFERVRESFRITEKS